MQIPDFDDKDLVIIGAVVLAGIAIFKLAEPDQVVLAALTGLFGLAVGRKGNGGGGAGK